MPYCLMDKPWFALETSHIMSGIVRMPKEPTGYYVKLSVYIKIVNASSPTKNTIVPHWTQAD
ncbi:metal-dependent hydrolases of the beta-lactamase superfamily III [Parabacteroides distasonis str. 3999B T(B) 6]|nr:metal-dependent hydrolases of the beta-lactamase superfamily III [Parabacteroides distasonis str. 3999B T(B) 4]KDS67304.1 metal-dependent hydrolases of the beta-lactamase superfamily III [Parabacteroides distasonis str. 3999B T(B) 4]KDS68915.1 metal-dependent hydrolases of the beta-lactamase superfamily III [Parabacteroides distasonis str. 3999B T(B) 6]